MTFSRYKYRISAKRKYRIRISVGIKPIWNIGYWMSAEYKYQILVKISRYAIPRHVITVQLHLSLMSCQKVPQNIFNPVDLWPWPRYLYTWPICWISGPYVCLFGRKSSNRHIVITTTPDADAGCEKYGKLLDTEERTDKSSKVDLSTG